MSSLDEQLERLLGLMVDRREEVYLERIERPDYVLFEAQAAPEDLGKLIGRQGRTARALRALLEARGAVDGEQYEFEIVEA